MKRQRRLLAHPGFLALLFVLGLLLFYWPHLLYAQEWRQPGTVIYLFAAWALLIFLIFWVSRSLRRRDGQDDDWPGRRRQRDD